MIRDFPCKPCVAQHDNLASRLPLNNKMGKGLQRAFYVYNKKMITKMKKKIIIIMKKKLHKKVPVVKKRKKVHASGSDHIRLFVTRL